jgi:hypothetical protein
MTFANAALGEVPAQREIAEAEEAAQEPEAVAEDTEEESDAPKLVPSSSDEEEEEEEEEGQTDDAQHFLPDLEKKMLDEFAEEAQADEDQIRKSVAQFFEVEAGADAQDKSEDPGSDAGPSCVQGVAQSLAGVKRRITGKQAAAQPAPVRRRLTDKQPGYAQAVAAAQDVANDVVMRRPAPTLLFVRLFCCAIMRHCSYCDGSTIYRMSCTNFYQHWTQFDHLRPAQSFDLFGGGSDVLRVLSKE